MLYNLAIEASNQGLKFVQAINDDELIRFVKGYNEGKESITINGIKLIIKHPELVKIFDVSKKIDPVSPSHVIDEMQNVADNKNNGYISINLLREFGEDVTSQFIKGEWGDSKNIQISPETQQVLSSQLHEAINETRTKIKNEKRYWAGGFGKGEEFYERLEDFKRNNYWQALDYDEDSNQAVADAAWALFREIKIGDWFLIKGYGGSGTLKVHYVGEVINKNEEIGRLDFRKLEVPLYHGRAPIGSGAGNWFNTLLEIYREDDIKKLFYSTEFATEQDTDLSEEGGEISEPSDDKLTNLFKGNLAHKFFNANNHNVADQLNVTNDIKAFASLLAYKNATPPIAIGLFGNWGSGKSYFMSNIRTEIENLKTSKDSDFCDRIVHVEFNSWFYRDADLWASLVSKIFLELNKFLNLDKQEASVESFYKELSSVKEDLEIISLELKETKLQHSTLNLKLDQVTAEKNAKAEELEGVSLKTVASAILENPLIRSEINIINNDLERQVGNSIDELNATVSELDTWVKRVSSAIKIFWKRKTSFAWFMGFMLIVLISIPVVYSSIQSQLERVVAAFVQFVAFITLTKTYFQPILDKVKSGYDKLKSITKTWDHLVEEEKKKRSEKEKELQAQIESVTLKEEELQSEINLKLAQEAILSKEITDIKSGKKLSEFVHERSTNSRYKSKLGIISWVREDFEELDNLIRRNKTAVKIENHKESAIPENIKIDRIILYVDDLDRCPENRVVEVLEAVHLLLSFELFGVVVGVDPRWVSHALKDKYKGLIEEEQSDNSSNASTYDYLEKIFQIPFALLPIEVNGTKNLLKSYIKTDGEVLQKTGNSNVTIGDIISTSQTVVSEIGEINLSDSQDRTTKKQIDSKKLNITKEEIEFILEFAEIIGNTPRTIQRFTNVYRIIRAHPNVILPEKFSSEHQCIIGFLSIIIGSPYLGGKLTKLIIKNENTDVSLFTLLKSIEDSERLVTILKTNVFEKFVEAKSIELKKWAPLVSRFSFRATEMIL